MRNFLPEQSGSYLDIGSGMPVWGSNSYLFYKVGWRGTCIDALRQNVNFSKVLRPFDNSIKALVGAEFGVFDFWEFDSYEYSTSDKSKSIEIMNSQKFISGEIRLVKIRQIQMTSINSLLPSIRPSDPFFLSVDIEGFDYNLLRIVDWSDFRPRVICVEDSGNLDSGRQSEIHRFISSLHYFRVGITPLSSIYVSKDYLKMI